MPVQLRHVVADEHGSTALPPAEPPPAEPPAVPPPAEPPPIGMVQRPLLQPSVHVCSIGAYVQLPPAQLPIGENVRSVVPETHVGAGGITQLTP